MPKSAVTRATFNIWYLEKLANQVISLTQTQYKQRLKKLIYIK
jgi:hypothetical protein